MIPRLVALLTASTLLASTARAAGAASAPLGTVVEEEEVLGHPDWRVVIVTPNLATERIVVGTKPGGGPLTDLLPKGYLLGLNGGYFDKAYRPTTWLVSEGRELKSRNRSAKGGVLWIKGQRLGIGPLAQAPAKPDFAVQNGPMLVEAEGHIGIKSDDGRRAARTVACLARDGEARTLRFLLILATPGRGPTLLEAATMLAKPKGQKGYDCAWALNLDGGKSTGVVFPEALSRPSYPPLVPIGYGLAIVRR